MPVFSHATGDFAQLLFHARLKQRGVEPLFVTSGALPFDVGAWNSTTQKFFRVQIKSTQSVHSAYTWKVNTKRYDRCKYTELDADILAVYVIPDDRFFILPISEVFDRVSISVPMKGAKRQHRFTKYIENWDLFGPATTLANQ